MQNKKTIYRRLTENIQNKICNFKEGKTTKDKLNDQLTLNIVSLIKFIQKNEEEKKLLKELKENNDNREEENENNDIENEDNDIENENNDIENEVNDTILDVFVPYSRLSRSLQLKLESINIPIIDENQEFEKDFILEENDFLMNDSDNEENVDKKKLTNFIEDDEDDNINNNINNNNNNINFLDESMSLMNMSLFNQPIDKDNYDPFTMGKSGINNINKKISNNNINPIVIAENDNIINNDNFSNKKSNIDKIQYNKKKEEEIKIAFNEFKNELKEKLIIETIKEMNIDYLRYMYAIYKKMKESCDHKELNEYKGLKYINQFKSFVLEIGISDKKFYEQCIREIIYNKNIFEFSEFLECFRKLLNLKYDQTFLKYKFLFYITERKHEDYFEEEDLNRFYNLVQNCKKIYDPDIYTQIKQKLLIKYKKFFPKDTKFYTRKLSLILEQFFDLK